MQKHTRTTSNDGLATLPSLAIAALGLGFLAWQMLTAPAPNQRVGTNLGRAAQLGVIFPPWSPHGLAAAAQLDLPIVALRWDGHLAVLDISGRPDARDALRSAGYFVINTEAPLACFAKKDTPNV